MSRFTEQEALALVQELLAMEGGDRRSQLEVVCDGRPALKRRVEQLLAASESSLDFPIVQLVGPPGLEKKLVKPEDEARGDSLAADPEVDSDWSADTPSATVARLNARRSGTSRYELRGEVATGGQGAIFQVWDEDLRRHLAMKVMLEMNQADDGCKSPSAASSTLGRFLEEAQVTGQLDHPGIVPVHELGVDENDRVFFTMKLVKGRDLREVVDLVSQEKEGWTLTRALNVLLKACEAISYAHAKGVIHRDLKPANIMVGRFGEVYVMDWGLAKVMGREDSRDLRIAPATATESLQTERTSEQERDPESPLITMDGTVMGTPSYMSPEQARGERALDKRTDVYAIGATLYHFLTGQVPFVPPGLRPSSHTVWRWVLEGPPRALRELNPNVPAELESICNIAMARQPDDRYADMSELAESLRAYLDNREKVIVEKEKAQASFNRLVGEAYSVVESDPKAALTLGLAASKYHGGPQVDRVLSLALSRHHRQQRVATHATRISFVVSSPDGMYVATGSASGVRVWDVAGESELWHLDHLQTVFLEFVPASNLLYVIALDAGREPLIRLLDVRTGECSVDLESGSTLPRSVAISPNGALLAAGYAGGGLVTWDLATGEVHCALASPDVPIDAICFLADSTALLMGGASHGFGSARIRTFCCERHTLGRSVELGITGNVAAVVAQPAGRQVAVAAGSSVVLLEEGDSSGEELGERGIFAVSATFHHHGNVYADDLRYSADGSKVVASALGPSVLVIDARRLIVQTVIQAGGRTRDFDIDSSRNELLVGTEHGVTVWSLESGSRCYEFHGQTGIVVTWLGSTRKIACAGVDRSARICSAYLPPSMTRTARSSSLYQTCAAASVRGRWLAVAAIGRGMNSIEIFDYAAGRSTVIPLVFGLEVSTLRFTGDQRHVLAGCSDGTCRLMEASTGKLTRIFRGHDGMVSSVELIPGTDQIITASKGKTVVAVFPGSGPLYTAADSKARIWDRESAKPLFVLDEHTSGILDVSVSNDGTYVATASEDGTVIVWSVADGRMVSRHAHSAPVTAVEFTQSARRVMSASNDGTLSLWNSESGGTEFELKMDSSVSAISLAGDDSTALVACADRRVWILTLSTQALDGPFRGHVGQVDTHTSSWNPNGVITHVRLDDQTGLAFTFSQEDGARLWDTRTFEQIGQPHRAQGRAMFGVLTADGEWIVSSGQCSYLEVRPTNLRAEALRRRPGPLSPDIVQELRLGDADLSFGRVSASEGYPWIDWPTSSSVEQVAGWLPFGVLSDKSDGSVEGLWKTRYGVMLLERTGDAVSDSTMEVRGSYFYSGTHCRLDGTLLGSRLEFRYVEPEASGRGWFKFSNDMTSFAGGWTQDGLSKESEWNGTRLEKGQPK